MSKEPLKIVVTGANGYIGSHLVDYLKTQGCLVTALTRTLGDGVIKMDITDVSEVRTVLEKTQPNIIIHTAGLNSLAKCEQDPNHAEAINVVGVKNIVKVITEIKPDLKLVFLSSDYVFAGDRGNYIETDERKPATVYGHTKAAAEDIITQNLSNYIICRTANVFGDGGNFFQFIVNNLRAQQPIEVFDNTVYTPTPLSYLLESIWTLIEKQFVGTIHVSGKDVVTRVEFAQAIARILGCDPNLIKPIHQPDSGLIATNNSLSSSLAQKLLPPAPTLDSALAMMLDKTIKPYLNLRDERGTFLGIINEGKWEEVNYIESVAGCTRGNHYHKQTTECFFIISGQIKVTLLTLDTKNTEEFILTRGDILRVAPNIWHSFEVLKDAQWINLLSQRVNEVDKDFHKL